jgi:hypothetical protein
MHCYADMLWVRHEEKDVKDFALTSTVAAFERRDFGWRFTDDLQEYVEQKLRLRLSVFLGEWYLDNTVGLPFLTDVFVKRPQWPVIESLFKVKIKDTTGVRDILEFALTFDAELRRLKVSFRVQLVDASELLMEV